MGKSSGDNKTIYLGIAVVVVAVFIAYYMNGKFNQHERAIGQLDQAITSLAEKTNNGLGLINNNVDAIKEELTAKIINLENQLMQLKQATRAMGIGGHPTHPRRDPYDDNDYLSSRVD